MKNCEVELLLCHLPVDCRIHILGYLSPTDLYANYAYCSGLCHVDSLNTELPQTRYGEFHVSMYNIDAGELSEQKEINMESLIRRIAHPSFSSAWRGPRCHMKILGHEQKADQKGSIVVSARTDDLSFEEMQELTSDVAFEDVTSLDMSVSNEINEEINASEHSQGKGSLNRALPRCLSWLLSTVLPGLTEVDLSNLHGGPMHEGDYISELSLFNATNCPNLRKIRWNNRVGGCYFLRGKDMKSLALQELYVDNIIADWRYDKLFAPLMNQFFDEASIIQRFFFFACNKTLERVSLKGGRYVTMGSLEKKIFPQWTLMRFVRRTAALKWFRSDLTLENMKLLSMERPDVHFCN